MSGETSAKRTWLGRRLRRFGPYDAVRIPTAILLFVAAGLKVHEMATVAAPLDLQSASGPTGWLLVAAVPVEIALAILLLVNRWPRATWGLALGLFTTFAVFAATGIAAGKESCGCFGTHSTSPTTALMLDAFVIVALIMVSPLAAAWRPRWFKPGQRLVYVGGVGAFLVGWQGAAFQIPRPLEVDAKYLDIGEQWEQENFKWVLPIRNMRDKPIEVTSISSSCTCTSIEPESFTAPAGGTVPLKLTLNLTDQERPLVSGEVQPIAFSLRPLLRGGTPLPIEWNVTGTTRKLLDGLPASIDFAKRSIVLGTAQSPREVEVQSKEPLQRLTAVCDPPVCDVEVFAMRKESRRWSLVLTPLLDGSTGYRTSKLILSAHIKGARNTVRVSAPVIMWIASDVEMLPREVAFGAIPVGDSATETIHFASESNAEYRILDLSPDGIPMTITELPPADTYRCTLVADKEGEQTGVLRASIQAISSGSVYELVKPVTYFGVVPKGVGMGASALSNDRGE